MSVSCQINSDREFRDKNTFVKVPKEFIGKWVIAKEYGTHGSYHIMLTEDGDFMCFDSKEHANAHKKLKGYGDYYEIIKISEDYPIAQVRFFICGMDTDGLLKWAKEKQQQRKEILETHRWIKVPKYKDDKSLSWEERYKRLEKHHIEETTFLIEKIRNHYR